MTNEVAAQWYQCLVCGEMRRFPARASGDNPGCRCLPSATGDLPLDPGSVRPSLLRVEAQRPGPLHAGRPITTIQRAEPKGNISRFVRRLGAALAALGAALAALSDRLAAWSVPYYEKGMGEEIEALPPRKRLDATLGWHARHGRML